LFVFRGKRGDILKILAWDGSGLVLCKRSKSPGLRASAKIGGVILSFRWRA
jgi:hypothetical protein